MEHENFVNRLTNVIQKTRYGFCQNFTNFVYWKDATVWQPCQFPEVFSAGRVITPKNYFCGLLIIRTMDDVQSSFSDWRWRTTSRLPANYGILTITHDGGVLWQPLQYGKLFSFPLFCLPSPWLLWFRLSLTVPVNILVDWVNIITGKQRIFCKCARASSCMCLCTSRYIMISFFAWHC